MNTCSIYLPNPNNIIHMQLLKCQTLNSKKKQCLFTKSKEHHPYKMSVMLRHTLDKIVHTCSNIIFPNEYSGFDTISV